MLIRFPTMGRPTMSSLPSSPSRRQNPHEVPALLPEPLFLRTLCLERKRAERSRQPFVLMLLERAPSKAAGTVDKPLTTIVPAVLSSIREIDTPGWYKDHTVLGILFVELGSADTPSILGALRTKITTALHGLLTAEEVARIRITFHRFPEERKAPRPGSDPETLPGPRTARASEKGLPRHQACHRHPGQLDGLGPRVADSSWSSASPSSCPRAGPVLFRQTRIGRYGIPFTCSEVPVHVHRQRSPDPHRVRQAIHRRQRQASTPRGPTARFTRSPRILA